jgi:RNA exonuclease 1
VVLDKCKSDADVESGIIRAVHGDHDGLVVKGGGVDFVWARMRELEALQGWWNRNRLDAADAPGPPALKDLPALARNTEASVAVTYGAEEGKKDGLPRHPHLPVVEKSTLEKSLAALAQRLKRVYDALPPCTGFIVFSGSGDPREMSRLQTMHQQWKREYNTPGKKWDELSVRWTEVEEQALKQAVRQARNGIGFITVK